jgi:hypothetical protein
MTHYGSTLRQEHDRRRLDVLTDVVRRLTHDEPAATLVREKF